MSDFFFFKQKTAYEMRISDWSSDVCSSDLARGQGAARRNLGAVGQRRTLELAEAEEALEEDLQPAADRLEVVGAAAGFREIDRPAPGVDVAPGVPGEERDRRRRPAVAADIVQEEIVQLVRAEQALGDRKGGGQGQRVEGSVDPGGC